MSLVVGHTCPGCGLDTPAVACEQCGEGVVWTRDHGTHCSACGLSAATLTCRSCGVRTDLDRLWDKQRIEPVASILSPRKGGEKMPSVSEAAEELPRATTNVLVDETPQSPSAALGAPSPRLCEEKEGPATFAARIPTLPALPNWRAAAVALSLAAPLLGLMMLPASDGPRPAPVAAPRQLAASPTTTPSHLLPVPVQPSPVPSRATVDPAPPTVYVVDTEPVAAPAPAPPPAPAPAAYPPQPRESAPRQIFRSGRTPAWEPPERERLLP